MKIWESIASSMLFSGGGGGGTSDYNLLTNLPKINNVTLLGNKSLSDLDITNIKSGNTLPTVAEEKDVFILLEDDGDNTKGIYYFDTEWHRIAELSKDGKLPFTSLKRLGAYTYEATFDTIPEYKEINASVGGGCTSFIKDGKLYRNLDWNYDNTAEFNVITKEFTGMAFIKGLDDGNLDYDKVEQLPYHINDGRNNNGIMVSSHILYNDFNNYSGSGDKDEDITLIPYFVLTNVSTMSELSSKMTDYLANLKIPTSLATLEYLMQFMVSDGVTTKIITPKTDGSGYEIVDISALPKLANFKWVNKATLERDDSDLQNRPTGTTRWNLIESGASLEDLRFTKCYETNVRLDEFIGESGTTKESTDAELQAIYEIAHNKYLSRTRNGELWQTCHSVVYGNSGIEHFWTQENYKKDFITQGGGGSNVEVVELTESSGVLTDEQITTLTSSNSNLISYNGKILRLSNKTSRISVMGEWLMNELLSLPLGMDFEFNFKYKDENGDYVSGSDMYIVETPSESGYKTDFRYNFGQSNPVVYRMDTPAASSGHWLNDNYRNIKIEEEPTTGQDLIDWLISNSNLLPYDVYELKYIGDTEIITIDTTTKEYSITKHKYTKDEIDTSLNLKADKSNTYTKTETNNLLSDKADKSTTYTKTEVDTALDKKANIINNGVDSSFDSRSDLLNSLLATSITKSNKAITTDWYGTFNTVSENPNGLGGGNARFNHHIEVVNVTGTADALSGFVTIISTLRGTTQRYICTGTISAGDWTWGEWEHLHTVLYTSKAFANPSQIYTSRTGNGVYEFIQATFESGSPTGVAAHMFHVIYTRRGNFATIDATFLENGTTYRCYRVSGSDMSSWTMMPPHTYQHNINLRLGTGTKKLLCTITNNSATKLTIDTFESWMKTYYSRSQGLMGNWQGLMATGMCGSTSKHI